MQEKKRTRTLRCANGRVRTFSTCKSHLEDMSLEFFGIQFLSSNCSVSEAGVMLFTAQTMCFQLSSCSGFFFFFKLSLVCHNLSAIAEPTPNWLRCYDAICCSYILNMRHWRYSPAHTHTRKLKLTQGAKLNQWEQVFRMPYINWRLYDAYSTFSVWALSLWQKTWPELKIENKMTFWNPKWARM